LFRGSSFPTIKSRIGRISEVRRVSRVGRVSRIGRIGRVGWVRVNRVGRVGRVRVNRVDRVGRVGRVGRIGMGRVIGGIGYVNCFPEILAHCKMREPRHEMAFLALRCSLITCFERFFEAKGRMRICLLSTMVLADDMRIVWSVRVLSCMRESEETYVSLHERLHTYVSA